MRILSIAKRVLKELLRDKRTLALMFLAPILVLTLMKVVFDTNDTSELHLGTINVESPIVKQLDDTKNTKIYKYYDKKDANKAIKNKKIDAIIDYKNDDYYVTYANIDASKTAASGATLKSALVMSNTKKLQSAVEKMQARLPIKNDSKKQQIPQIHNKYLYGDSSTGFFSKILPILMGFFVFFFVFLISGMALLKERTTGTLDRLLATPVKRSDIVFGYMLGYGILAIIQTLIIVLFTIVVLNVEVVGNISLLILVNILLPIVALAFGLLMSTFAKSEFQMMQFIPLIIVPQIFLSGLIPLESMAKWLQGVAYIMPLKYAGEALSGIVLSGDGFSDIGIQLGVLLIFIMILTILNIVGLKRYRKV